MKIDYESNGKTCNVVLKEPVTKCDMREILPTLYRFKTINTLKKVNLTYKRDFDGARKILQDFVDEYASKDLDDEMSQGIQKNLVE